ncbi:hypothetical protein DL769_008939 [Monosporascus sp. CRB-8-3]|nr:hypothetical protein DL769_008939 [Monosporascus sp. CRB-8-3]
MKSASLIITVISAAAVSAAPWGNSRRASDRSAAFQECQEIDGQPAENFGLSPDAPNGTPAFGNEECQCLVGGGVVQCQDQFGGSFKH